MSHTLAFFFLASLPLGITAEAQPWITAYYTDGSMNLTDIPWSKVTHVVHMSTSPSDAAGGITAIDPASADAFTAAAHQGGAKALLCVRDNNSYITLFSTVLRNNLHGFADNIASFALAHNYDGVDLDWEAGNYDGPIDQNNYVNLILAMRASLGPGKVISMSVYWDQGLATVVQTAAASLDQVNVMCYDMDQHNQDLYFNTATYTATGDFTHDSCAAQTARFEPYIAASKIGVGIPFYGRIWSGCSNFLCSDGLHDPLQAWWGNPTQKSLHFHDLVSSQYWSLPHSWDGSRSSSYISVDQAGAGNDRFITYTDGPQINAMVQLMKSRGYGGVMEYELEYEFIAGASGDAQHPLTSAVYTAVFGSQ
jgi:GH18 family chitinase